LEGLHVGAGLLFMREKQRGIVLSGQQKQRGIVLSGQQKQHRALELDPGQTWRRPSLPPVKIFCQSR
jgi:hypothetical protein